MSPGLTCIYLKNVLHASVTWLLFGSDWCWETPMVLGAVELNQLEKVRHKSLGTQMNYRHWGERPGQSIS